MQGRTLKKDGRRSRQLGIGSQILTASRLNIVAKEHSNMSSGG